MLLSGQTIPNPSMMILYALSQVALVLYMFLVGLDFNTHLFKNHFKSASVISISGVIVPFILGACVIYFMPNSSELFQAHIPLSSAAIFLGASLSITAFPVMARILEENHIINTNFGTLALAAGSMGDLAAWIMLAALLSIIKGNASIVFFAIVGAFIYFILIICAHKILKRQPQLSAENENGFPKQLLTIVLAMLMLCAWFTDRIGIYSVFGAFLAGIALPRGVFTQQVQARSLTLVNSLLLPTFFVFSGLNTQIGLLNTPALWCMASVIILIAIIGKGVGCMLAAKLVGESWRDSATIGALMNARGLMELIIINIGLQEGIITLYYFGHHGNYHDTSSNTTLSFISKKRSSRFVSTIYRNPVGWVEQLLRNPT
jgi:Kef-type K+ transport system membrane component KefB